MKCGVNGSWGSGKVWLIKTDENGDSLWSKAYSKRWNSWGNFVQQTTDGGYIVTGITGTRVGGETPIFAIQGDIWLLKTDESGDTLWTKTWGDSGGYFAMDAGHSVQQTLDSGYIITGNTNSYSLRGDSTYGAFLIKTDEHGNTLWIKAFEGSGSSVQQTIDGGYIIAGTNLIKTDENGDSLWTKTYGGHSVKQTNDEGYILVGVYNNNELWLIKTNENGDTLWTKIIEGTGKFVQQTSDGGYIVTGSKDGDVLLIKVAPDITSIGENVHVYVDEYQLFQNHPNPFNPSTTIEFTLPKSEFTTLKVYNILGKEVSTLVSTKLQQGNHTYTFDGSNLASGIYYYQLVAGDYREVKKMILIK